MIYVDTNILLRYIVDDNDKLSPIAKEILENEDYFIPTEILAEVVYVLASVYEAPRQLISKALETVIKDTNPGFTDKYVIEKALEMFANTKLDFVDCLLAAYSIAGGAEIATFDDKLKRMIDKSAAEA